MVVAWTDYGSMTDIECRPFDQRHRNLSFILKDCRWLSRIAFFFCPLFPFTFHPISAPNPPILFLDTNPPPLVPMTDLSRMQTSSPRPADRRDRKPQSTGLSQIFSLSPNGVVQSHLGIAQDISSHEFPMPSFEVLVR